MKKNEEIKTIIINNTRELMRNKANITIKDIALKSYVNIAAVNYYFGDKENLILTVTKQVINEFKDQVFMALDSITPEEKIEDIFAKMIGVIYRFALENIGILNYMFSYSDTQNVTSNFIIQEFLSDNAFTRTILLKIKESCQDIDSKTLYAKYMLLFSSFCVPLFIELLQEGSHDKKLDISSLKDDEFRRIYINELIKIIK